MQVGGINDGLGGMGNCGTEQKGVSGEASTQVYGKQSFAKMLYSYTCPPLKLRLA